jgi:hypothetical protein
MRPFSPDASEDSFGLRMMCVSWVTPGNPHIKKRPGGVVAEDVDTWCFGNGAASPTPLRKEIFIGNTWRSGQRPAN